MGKKDNGLSDAAKRGSGKLAFQRAAGVPQAARLGGRLGPDQDRCCPGYCQWPSSCPRVGR